MLFAALLILPAVSTGFRRLITFSNNLENVKRRRLSPLIHQCPPLPPDSAVPSTCTNHGLPGFRFYKRFLLVLCVWLVPPSHLVQVRWWASSLAITFHCVGRCLYSVSIHITRNSAFQAADHLDRCFAKWGLATSPDHACLLKQEVIREKLNAKWWTGNGSTAGLNNRQWAGQGWPRVPSACLESQ